MNEKEMEINERGKPLVARLQRHQAALGLNHTQYVRRYQRYLSSTRSWERLCRGAFEEFGDPAEWLRKIEAMVAEIDGVSPLDEFFDDLPFARHLTDLFERLLTQQTDRRCVVVLATTGTGKSKWAIHIKNKHPREVVYLRCNEAWRESKRQIVQGIAKAVNCPWQGYSHPGALLSKLIEHLKINPLTIIIDEGNEGGVLLLKMVKTLIDESPSRFMLLSFPTTWRSMLTASDDARSEAMQLFGRCLKPVFADYAKGVKKEDVVFYLRHAAGLKVDVEAVAARILPLVHTNGNLRLLADAVEAAKIQSDALERPLDGELVIAQVQALCPAANKDTNGHGERRGV
jgi:hypothetical protein